MANKKYPYREQFTGRDGVRRNIRANTHQELIDKVAKVKRDIEQGYDPLRSTTTTVKKWSELCFEKYKINLDPHTLYIQKNCFDKHVTPIIGRLKLVDVKPLHCQDVINHTAGLSNYTIRRVSQLMRFVFEKAVENGLMYKNPAKGIVLPKGGKTERRALTQYEEDLVYKTVEKDKRYVFFLVMLLCGLRNSEVAGLRGMDLIQINGRYFLHINGTKTKNAVRDVPCPDYLRERLPGVTPFEYLFINQKGEQMKKYNYDKLWRHFKRDMNITAGCRVYRNELLPPYPVAADLCSYDLRHTYCTNLMKRGIDIRIAQKLMGHADIRMTANIYSHADRDSLTSVADVLNDNIDMCQGTEEA